MLFVKLSSLPTRNVAPIETPSVSDPPQLHTSPILTLVTQSQRVTQKRGRDIVDENDDSVDDFPLPPPAKKKSRLRLTFCDAEESITNLEKRVTRSSKRNKK